MSPSVGVNHTVYGVNIGVLPPQYGSLAVVQKVNAKYLQYNILKYKL